MVDKIPKELCTGCSSCINGCPFKALHLEIDLEGFYYPVIGKDCRECKICNSKCPTFNKQNKKNSQYFKNPKVFAAWSIDQYTRYYSTSGGIFTELANEILQNGEYIVGAQYTEDFMVEHKMIDTTSEIFKIRQSKYLQSNIGYIYKSILQGLKKGKKILFSGTPCPKRWFKNFFRKRI